MSRKRLGWLILILAGAASVLAGFMLPSGEHEKSYWWSSFRAVFALVGLVGCGFMIFVVKWLGHKLLQRKEDYYK